MNWQWTFELSFWRVWFRTAYTYALINYKWLPLDWPALDWPLDGEDMECNHVYKSVYVATHSLDPAPWLTLSLLQVFLPRFFNVLAPQWAVNIYPTSIFYHPSHHFCTSFSVWTTLRFHPPFYTDHSMFFRVEMLQRSSLCGSLVPETQCATTFLKLCMT